MADEPESTEPARTPYDGVGRRLLDRYRDYLAYSFFFYSVVLGTLILLAIILAIF